MSLFLRSRLFLPFTFLCVFGAYQIARSEPAPRAGSAQTSDVRQQSASAQPAVEYITLPGPLRSFLRMSGISQKVSPEEVLPLFGHFVETYGYEGSKQRSPKQTEALTLFKRYFVQANTLASLAGPDQMLHFDTCEGSRQLLADLGYRLLTGCGKNPTIEVDDADRAFITVDSGFPLADLQNDLHEGKPFRVPYVSSRLPLIFDKEQWTGHPNSADIDVVTTLADNPSMARLYWALSRLDNETRLALLKAGGVPKVLSYGSVLDFYGSSIAVRDGRVAVPGGAAAEQMWAKLAGADPASPSDFVLHVVSKDGGWLAEYYDAISRAPEPQLKYFTSGDHLQRFYAAFHGNDTSAESVRSIFRPGASLLVLATRLPLNGAGQPLVPGSLKTWRDAMHRHAASKEERDFGRKNWNNSDDFVAALFSLGRSNSIDGPLEMYNTLGELDRNRPVGEQISADTANLLINHYTHLHDQYAIFCEFTQLNGASIEEFVKATEKMDAIHDPMVRADTMGTFEATLGLWQIFARQRQIPAAQMNETWRQTIAPFEGVAAAPQLFDATRTSLAALMKGATGDANVTQAKLIDVLAGPQQSTPDGRQVHEKLADEMSAVLTDQRLVSLDTLVELGDDFAKLTHTPNGVDAARAANLAEELEEARSPRAMFTEAERAEWAPGHEPNKHVMLEMRTDLKKSISGAEPPNQATEMRGALTPFLRDTLVGLNYAYYEPPGAQILHNSPLLVREHDFLASESVGSSRAWEAPELFGIGLTAGNGTHLSGSLAGLPYALAEVEQDFIVPENVQALIWHDTAADLLTTGVVPRWWSTSPDALHAAALYQRTGEEIVTSAAKDAALRKDVALILSNRLAPETLDRFQSALEQDHADLALEEISPADTFYLAAEFRQDFPSRNAWGAAGNELDRMVHANPGAVSVATLEHDFGTPHPVLAQSYGDEMLNLRPFPSLMDYASELLAESWESTNLYWARLADEMGYTPATLNVIAPVLTRRMVEKIFGSDFDDWPALMRAMRETGEEFKHGQVAGVPKVTVAVQSN
jgi:hypothetical protein